MYKESEIVGLKKSLVELKEGIISLSSMLNKSNKGEVYYGIDEEGNVIGVDVSKKTISDVNHMIRDNIKPLPTRMSVQALYLEEKSVIKVSVEGQDSPYSAYGKYYIREKDKDVLMNSNEFKTFFEKKQDNYLAWESEETCYGINEVDEKLLMYFIEEANKKGRIAYDYSNSKDILQKLGLMSENGNLNNAGLYLFGNNKPLKIDLIDEEKEDVFEGNIFECIDEALRFIKEAIGYNNTEVEIPVRAIKEIVINSFAHAYYGSDERNRYVVTKSLISIYNPGSISKSIDPIRFASGAVGSKMRNVLISSTLYEYGLLDSFGTGFDKIFKSCSQRGIRYSYTSDEKGFTFNFERKSISN